MRLGSFKEEVSFICQITFKMKSMLSFHGLDLFTIPLFSEKLRTLTVIFVENKD